MNKQLKILTFIAAVGFSGVANAALVDRGGGLIYDTELNITWLANANYAMTSGYDADGRMFWSVATTWASNLSYYDSVRNATYTDWRLPSADPACGYSYNCTDSEMGHLFYAELGGVAGQDIATTRNANYNLFQNVMSAFSLYWSGTPYAPNNNYAWNFNFYLGFQNADINVNTAYAWAVRDGDVAIVPVPAAVWLFGSGLLGLIGIARRKKA